MLLRELRFMKTRCIDSGGEGPVAQVRDAGHREAAWRALQEKVLALSFPEAPPLSAFAVFPTLSSQHPSLSPCPFAPSPWRTLPSPSPAGDTSSPSKAQPRLAFAPPKPSLDALPGPPHPPVSDPVGWGEVI